MIISKSVVLEGKHQKPILVDIKRKNTNSTKPVIIFCHGYKGFKDWGAWNLMASAFANAGFYLIKFNFSHNGGTMEQPIDFPDLDAFGNNNYIIELDDLETVIDWLYSNPEIKNECNLNNINLLGHSRGGGIVIIKAEEDNRIHRVISLAGVSDFEKRTVNNIDVEKWKKEGVIYVINGRTKQQMPHYFQFYENFIENKNRLNIKRAASNLKMPFLIIHGNEDSSVSIDEAYALHDWNSKSKLEIIDGANHVFGAQHPLEKHALPKHLEGVVQKVDAFIRQS